MRRQLRALGLGHDPRRSVATTDPAYYRWTQWIFLQLFDSWYDEDADRARPIAELIPVLEADPEVGWATLDARERRVLVDSYRLAYLDDAPVNWCPRSGPCSPTKRSPRTAGASAATIPSTGAR